MTKILLLDANDVDILCDSSSIVHFNSFVPNNGTTEHWLTERIRYHPNEAT